MPDGLFTPWRIAILMVILAAARLLASLSLEPSKARKNLNELLDSGLIALGLVFLVIRPLIVQAFYIPTGSMEPTLLGQEEQVDPERPEEGVRRRPGDRVLVCKFLYDINPPRRGDIVVFRAPPAASEGTYRVGKATVHGRADVPQDFIKRLIGLPGDRIQVRPGDGVYVNGVRLDEPYIASDDQLVRYRFPDDGGEYEVPEGQVFVLGDNRNNSNDSHVWRSLPRANLVGKAMAIFYPPTRIRILH